jgi:hypothetical protein
MKNQIKNLLCTAALCSLSLFTYAQVAKAANTEQLVVNTCKSNTRAYPMVVNTNNGMDGLGSLIGQNLSLKGMLLDGVLLENDKGEQIFVCPENHVFLVKSFPFVKKNIRNYPMLQQIHFVGTTDSGVPVWAGEDKKNLTIDMKSGKGNPYEGRFSPSKPHR